MSEEPPYTWGQSFDYMVKGGTRRFRAGREAKYDNPFGPNRPQEQQPKKLKDGGLLQELWTG